MKFCIYLVLLSFSIVYGKGSVKSLTDSRGQEIIEIASPIKAELPPGLEEEPSAEVVEDDVTSTTLVLATKKDIKKTTMSPKSEDITLSSEEEERVEKELSEIYKDTDYKSDNNKELQSATFEEKPILRSKTEFKFQPDSNRKEDIERFRTSVDNISCNKRVTKKLAEPAPANAGSLLMTSFTIIGPAFLCFVTA